MSVTGDGRELRGERTRGAILQAARRVIMARGYTAASMREIAEEAGITAAAIYNHFASKEALFSAVLEEVVPLAELTAFLHGLQGDSAEALVEEAFRGLLQIIISHEDYVRLALIDVQEREGATMAAFLPRFIPLMIGFVQRVQAADGAQGRLRELQPAVIVRTFMSVLVGFVVTERVMRLERVGLMPALDWPGALLDVLMYGLFEQVERGSDEDDGQ